MTDNSKANTAEIGRQLSKVREKAGIKQNELSKRVTISPAVLSRIENGERDADESEIISILTALGTDDAENIKARIGHNWLNTMRPALDHPAYELLWNAESAIKSLKAVGDDPSTKSAFIKRIDEYIREIEEKASRVLSLDYQIAFIGSIGIGKTTAICKMIGLEIPQNDVLKPVLETGAGGTTVCEVQIMSGPQYGIVVSPRNENQIREDVYDFAEYIFDSDSSTNQNSERQGISKELERAIRNMSGLTIKREKGLDGKNTRIDNAKIASTEFGTSREFALDVLSKMALHKRDKRQAWFDPSEGREPFSWIRANFELINNGRHPDFTVPNQIDIILPVNLFDNIQTIKRVIDTKGIDRTSAREDLEKLIDDPFTISILCSSFNDAPASEIRLLLERSIDAGVSDIRDRGVILVLPRPNEALAVKDGSGLGVETDHEGYEIKGEQIDLSLSPLINGFESVFFNSTSDPSTSVLETLEGKIDRLLTKYRNDLSDSIEVSLNVIENQQEEQSKEVILDVKKILFAWMERKFQLSKKEYKIEDSLLKEIGSSNASTIHATARRMGEWYNLRYSHHLGYGARRMAVLTLENVVDEFTSLCYTLQDSHSDAADILEQASGILQSSYEELLRSVQVAGRSAFSESLNSDASLWSLCLSEWGKGSGYRDRVLVHNMNWFNMDSSRRTEESISEFMEREWVNILVRIKAIFPE